MIYFFKSKNLIIRATTIKMAQKLTEKKNIEFLFTAKGHQISIENTLFTTIGKQVIGKGCITAQDFLKTNQSS